MELIPTTDQQLRHLGHHDPNLAPYFARVFPSDRLPAHPIQDRPHGYIVNIDTHDQPASHWIALWTNDQACTVMDSFAIPLPMCEPHALLDWLTDHFKGYRSNHHAMQAMDSQVCGLYSLMFLVHMSVRGTLDTFTDIFSRHDFVKNNRQVAQWFQHLVERDLTWHHFKHLGQMDKAPDYKSGDSRFESWQGPFFFSVYKKDISGKTSRSCFVPCKTSWWWVLGQSEDCFSVGIVERTASLFSSGP